MCVCVTPCSSMSASVRSADQPSIITTGTPSAAGAVNENDSGAAWYSGPVHRCTCRWPRYCVSAATSSALLGSGGRRTPFGRPVVPDV